MWIEIVIDKRNIYIFFYIWILKENFCFEFINAILNENKGHTGKNEKLQNFEPNKYGKPANLAAVCN